jgi:hypothetical protein
MSLIFISVTTPPRPEDVLPLLDRWAAPLYDCLRDGIDFANSLQPDPESRERWYWAHSARFVARKELIARGAPLTPKTPNAGIHLVLDGIHTARVLRSLWGSAPHPGRNAARQKCWVGVKQHVQGQFAFATTTGTALSPLSLLVDWQMDAEDEPIVHVSLPISSWRFTQRARLHWRVPLRDGGADAYSDLRFDAPDDGGEPQIIIDPADLEVPELG